MAREKIGSVTHPRTGYSRDVYWDPRTGEVWVQVPASPWSLKMYDLVKIPIKATSPEYALAAAMAFLASAD